ncbi:MAG: ribosomal-protein-alanine N-acetyltransferase [Gemmatimonas sp.]|nr:ribosomal-protein-alanine N-acetyltransferase [Gemmatimonas sp.]
MGTVRTAASGPAVIIRAMQDSDLSAVAAIEAASFSDAWPRSAFAELMPRGYARLRVAVTGNGEVCGYCVLLLAGGEGEIANIATHPAWRGRGVGRSLLREALAAADEALAEAIFLEVRESNAAARALYAAQGFVQVGRRKQYYQQPAEDALVMRRARGASAPSSRAADDHTTPSPSSS